MVLALLTLLTAISISGIAAYFSIVGLVAIFSATPISIAIMGGLLEAAKLVSASWVYRNWSTAPSLIRYYLVGAVVVLSIITSLGIFGYLSKSHIQQSSVIGTNTVELEMLAQQEQILKSRVDFLIKQDSKTTFASNRISRELQETQTQLKEIINRKLPLLQNKNQLEAEVGPLKYITEFIYDTSNEELLSKSVRWVIIALIFVFDPLAILLLICANISFKQVNHAVQVEPVSIDINVKKPRKRSTKDIKVNKSEIHDMSQEVIDTELRKVGNK